MRQTSFRAVTCVLALFLALPTPLQANALKRAKNLPKTASQASKAAAKASEAASRNIRRADLAAKVKPAVQAARPPKLRRLPWDPETKIKNLLAATPNPSLVLPQIWDIQNKYGNHNLFGVLAMRFYVQEFGLVTPHLNKLFKQVARLNNHRIETAFLGQMRFLATNQNRILRALTSHKIPQSNIRIRYTADVDKITAQNFNAQKLVLSVEQRMNPVEEKDFPVRHVNAQSVLEAASGQYAVYQYAGPTDLIPTLYRYLLNGPRRAPVTLVFDEENKSLAMYNADKTLWLRVTPHEYETPKKLHIHLNEQRTVSFTDANGHKHTVPVNVNLSIPLLPPDNLPSEKTAAQRFLYEKLVLHPVKSLQGDKRVTIERRPIF